MKKTPPGNIRRRFFGKNRLAVFVTLAEHIIERRNLLLPALDLGGFFKVTFLAHVADYALAVELLLEPAQSLFHSFAFSYLYINCHFCSPPLYCTGKRLAALSPVNRSALCGLKTGASQDIFLSSAKGGDSFMLRGNKKNPRQRRGPLLVPWLLELHLSLVDENLQFGIRVYELCGEYVLLRNFRAVNLLLSGSGIVVADKDGAVVGL